jgi:hypothetical protein
MIREREKATGTLLLFRCENPSKAASKMHGQNAKLLNFKAGETIRSGNAKGTLYGKSWFPSVSSAKSSFAKYYGK